MKKSILLISGLIFGLLIGCAKDDEGANTSPTLDGSPYGVVEPGDLKHNGETIVGSGSIIFVNPLPGTEIHSKLGFSLEEGGSVTWVVFAQKGLKAGSRLKVARKDDLVTITGPSGTPKALGRSVDLEILSIEFHNEGTHQHLAVWTGKNSNIKKDDPQFVDEGFPQETGLYHGLVLVKATVLTSTVEKGKLDDGEFHKLADKYFGRKEKDHDHKDGDHPHGD